MADFKFKIVCFEVKIHGPFLATIFSYMKKYANANITFSYSYDNVSEMNILFTWLYSNTFYIIIFSQITKIQTNIHFKIYSVPLIPY